VHVRRLDPDQGHVWVSERIPGGSQLRLLRCDGNVRHPVLAAAPERSTRDEPDQLRRTDLGDKRDGHARTEHALLLRGHMPRPPVRVTIAGGHLPARDRMRGLLDRSCHTPSGL
jgi:hypothetical protein